MSLSQPVTDFLANYADYRANDAQDRLGLALLRLRQDEDKLAAAETLVGWPLAQHGPHHGLIVRCLLKTVSRSALCRKIQATHHIPLLLATQLSAEEAEDMILDVLEGFIPPGQETRVMRFFDLLLERAPAQGLPQAIAGIWARSEATTSLGEQAIQRWLAQPNQDGSAFIRAVIKAAEVKDYGCLSKVGLIRQARQQMPGLATTFEQHWPGQDAVPLLISWLAEPAEAPWPAIRDDRMALWATHLPTLTTTDDAMTWLGLFLEDEAQAQAVESNQSAEAIKAQGFRRAVEVLRAHFQDPVWQPMWQDSPVLAPTLDQERAEQRQDQLAQRPALTRPRPRRRS